MGRFRFVKHTCEDQERTEESEGVIQNGVSFLREVTGRLFEDK